jgi:thiol-disulfide isomerase/thioredoxin
MVAIFAALGLLACNPAAKANAITSDDSSTTARAAPASSPQVSPQVLVASPGLRVASAPADSDALSAIRTTRLTAKAEGRVLVVYVGATWCEPCKKFKAELASGRLDERLGKVSLLAFDADKDVDRLAAAGYSFRFVPFVALPGPDGHPADTAQATGKSPDAWRELLAKLDAWQQR